jgi:hypothetical protein
LVIHVGDIAVSLFAFAPLSAMCTADWLLPLCFLSPWRTNSNDWKVREVVFKKLINRNQIVANTQQQEACLYWHFQGVKWSNKNRYAMNVSIMTILVQYADGDHKIWDTFLEEIGELNLSKGSSTSFLHQWLLLSKVETSCPSISCELNAF